MSKIMRSKPIGTPSVIRLTDYTSVQHVLPSMNLRIIGNVYLILAISLWITIINLNHLELQEYLEKEKSKYRIYSKYYIFILR